MTGYKLVPVEPTAEMVAALKARLKTTSRGGILNAGHALADAISAAPVVQGEPEVFCEDAVLTLAERTFSTEVDDQMAGDIIQFAQRLYSRWVSAPKEQSDE